MELLRLDQPFPETLERTVVVLGLEGWTDAGNGGSIAAGQLLEQLPSRRLGGVDPDEVFDYRGRRPLLGIDRGELADPQWPALDLHLLEPGEGPDLLLLTGAEPDFHWQGLCDDLVEVGRRAGAERYVGLGSVPGPIPHTRPARLIATSSDTDLLEEIGRPHERVVVPASFQVIVETRFRDAGLTTLGLWARIPHYVAGEYPEAARLLLRQMARYLQLPLDPSVLDGDVEEHRQRLDVAASGSPEVEQHIEQLEETYDSDAAVQGGLGGPLPTGDQIAAEVERFLRDQDEEPGPGPQ